MRTRLGAADRIGEPLDPPILLLKKGSTEIPTCTFDGWVKKVGIVDEGTNAVFGAAFPAFLGGADEHVFSDAFSGRYRRYAGSDTLSRGCYFGVCHWSGDDLGCVAREIFAYAAPAKTGIVIIDDMADAATAAAANARYGAGFERGEYFLLCLVEPERVIPAQWQDACRAAGKLPNFFEIPWVKERKSLDKVVDLRLPRVQQWFFEEFTDPERLNLGWALPEMSSFHEMLALLQGQHRGGNPLTQAIGRELRLMGVNGLVFPSARCDAAAIVRQGSIVDWYGWNLVDYSQRESGWDAGTMTTMNDLEVLKNGWEFFGFPVGSVKVRLSTRDTFDRGTWQVVGLEAANVLEWTRKLSSDQRRSLGLAADQDLVAGSEDGLHQVEKDFRRRFRELTSQHPEVGLSEQRVRDLLTRVALAIADLPFARLSGDLLTSKDKLGEMAKAGADLDAFLSAATGIGFLVEEAKGYYRMSSKVILDYFASRGPR